jgi:hypothetical protein
MTGYVEKTASLRSVPRRVFLLSPASIAGIRGRLVMRESAASEMAVRLRQDGVPLGELFSFMLAIQMDGSARLVVTAQDQCR